MPQRIDSSEVLYLTIEDERGIVVQVSIDPSNGPKSFTGRLLAERGSGERVTIEEPLRFLDELWSMAYTEGLKAKAAE